MHNNTHILADKNTNKLVMRKLSYGEGIEIAKKIGTTSQYVHCVRQRIIQGKKVYGPKAKKVARLLSNT